MRRAIHRARYLPAMTTKTPKRTGMTTPAKTSKAADAVTDKESTASTTQLLPMQETLPIYRPYFFGSALHSIVPKIP